MFAAKDNKFLAIIAINFSIIFGVAFIAAFKVVAREGFDPTEFVLCRCLCSFPVAAVWCAIAG